MSRYSNTIKKKQSVFGSLIRRHLTCLSGSIWHKTRSSCINFVQLHPQENYICILWFTLFAMFQFTITIKIQCARNRHLCIILRYSYHYTITLMRTFFKYDQPHQNNGFSQLDMTNMNLTHCSSWQYTFTMSLIFNTMDYHSEMHQLYKYVTTA